MHMAQAVNHSLPRRCARLLVGTCLALVSTCALPAGNPKVHHDTSNVSLAGIGNTPLPRVYPREEPRPCDQVHVPTQDDMLDLTRDQIEEIICRAALWLDGFGGHGNVLAARRSHGRLETSYYWSEFSGAETRVRFKVRVELPALKERLSAFVGLDNDDDFVRGRSEGFALRSEFPSLDDDDDWLAGLGYGFPSSSRVFKSDLRIGAKRLTDTEFFVQNRFRYLAYSDDNDVVRLREILFWTNKDGLGSTSGLDWMHVISADLLARWDTVGTVSQESEGLDWRSAAWLYYSLGGEKGLALEAFSRGESRHVVPVREYGLRMLYRHPLFRRRVYMEIITGYTWPRVDPTVEREGSFGIGVGLQLPFGPKNA